ncbi:hypothetical protein CLOM_g4709 [Closterium sp. NIES-68]|nr:hypothetical protein CLOM_g4709 [Closterium sp. NIES-68]GJP57986.1 hypothetical protein CLOP_g19902 [Closterium sp. NIES-67]GJP71612.1 hypothetical protein CLOP_g2429 [Closterium sp. NIES-67]
MSVEKCASLVAEPSSSNTNNYFVPNRAPAQHASPEPARNTSTPGRATERPEQLYPRQRQSRPNAAPIPP